MRKKICTQPEFDFQPSNLKVTNEYFARYEAISTILGENPEIVGLVHNDLKEGLGSTERGGPGPKCRVSSDTLLRITICQILEGETLRGTVIRIDDSNYLRRFTRIYNGPMLDFTHLCRLRNCIRPETWKKINETLTAHAVKEKKVTGTRLRLDTTAFETNIHWPTDSSLLWDTYRVLGRLIDEVRTIDQGVVGSKRLMTRVVKRLTYRIARVASRKGRMPQELETLYKRVLRYVEAILSWSADVRREVQARLDEGAYGVLRGATLEGALREMKHYEDLGSRVVDQASRRVLHGESVPNEEKIFSLFEPHTELLKRGKAGKDVEFGHMVALEQVDEKFITGYDVFAKRPRDSDLADPAIQRHRKLFGHAPTTLAADMGYYGDSQQLSRLRAELDIVAIPKRGKRNEEESARERSLPFKLGQQFRAGVEGSISFLKRALGMWRCLNKGWEHYASTVGATVFVHNLLILGRAST